MAPGGDLAISDDLVVRLRCASLPPPLGLIAVHFWFTVSDPHLGCCDRWEVWQTPDVGGESFGHLHRNLQGSEGGVGGGPARVVAQWTGDAARRLSSTLRRAASDYPYRDRYRAWPGPNSNTFAAWTLRRAGVVFPLPWKAFGKRYAF